MLHRFKAGRGHHKLPIRADVIVAMQPRDRLIAVRVNVAPLRIQAVTPHMHMHHLAQHDHPTVIVDQPFHPTFHRTRAFPHPPRGHLLTRGRGQPGQRNLIHIRVNRQPADQHGIGYRHIYHVHHKFAAATDACLRDEARVLRDDMRLIAVVLGTKDEKSRAQESLELLNYGYRFYETHRLYAAGQPLYTLPIWKGAEKNLRLGLRDDLYVTVPRGQYKNLAAAMEVDARIIAPAAKGKTFGAVKITLGGDVIAKPALVALHDVAKGGLWRRMIDSIRLWWH